MQSSPQLPRINCHNRHAASVACACSVIEIIKFVAIIASSCHMYKYAFTRHTFLHKSGRSRSYPKIIRNLAKHVMPCTIYQCINNINMNILFLIILKIEFYCRTCNLAPSSAFEFFNLCFVLNAIFFVSRSYIKVYRLSRYKKRLCEYNLIYDR